MPINQQQIRAARGLLGWSQTDLANHVGLSVTSINQIERGLVTARLSNLEIIQKAFEHGGVQFTSQSGVRLKQNSFISMEGPKCISFMQDDLLETLKDGGEVCAMGVSDRQYADADEKAMSGFLKHARAAGITERVIVEEGDNFFLFPPDVTQYRWIDKRFFYSLPFYTYKNKVAFIIWGDPIKLILIEDENLYNGFMTIFESFWSLSNRPASIKSKYS
jgi:transcriptional regulator with XRE-family HTH domain